MKNTQKITPNLWFDHTAEEAVDFYTSVFPSSSVDSLVRYPDSQAEGLADFQLDLAGQVLTIEFTLAGNRFTAINAGSEFAPTPSHSTTVYFDTKVDENAREHLDEVWERLMEDGSVLMPLQRYDFSDYYGWVQDKYGYSWQLMLLDATSDERNCMVPSLLFGGNVQNRAKEAVEYYLSVFHDTKLGSMMTYQEAGGVVTTESVRYADFQLEGQWFIAMDSGEPQDFTFTEAVSFVITCADQADIDYYWSKLSTQTEFEQCGWCKDQFGVSWQIVPENLDELMRKPGAFAKLMEMKKIIIADFNS